MANYIKKDIEMFEYDKRYSTLIEHRWCFLRSDHNLEVFDNRKEKITKPIFSIVQSNPETTGQYGTML